MYNYLKENGCVDKKTKVKKKCKVIRFIKFQDYKDSLQNNNTTEATAKAQKWNK